MTGQKVLFPHTGPLMVLNDPQGKTEGNVDGREEIKLTVFVGVVIKRFTLPPNSCNSGCFLRELESCCVLRELLGFDQWLVTRSPPIGKDI